MQNPYMLDINVLVVHWSILAGLLVNTEILKAFSILNSHITAAKIRKGQEFEHSIYFYSLLHLCTTTTAVHMVGSIAVFELLKVFTFSDKKKVAFQPGPKPVMEIESEKTQQFLHKSDYSEKTIKTIE
ncbi:hypothetical protein HK103_003188 [Boothiomyces macroporosus]|uniref:Uncharacterized protein n=1 Tax=Boothiomyces macroporosus TaxID=261099 RepID=A0AAD5UCI7_9FUNG|nr:hypothetical protein HK103_003188 [Boothiomyces macroporosus]